MIHRLALLMGGTGAAGVLALALGLGGFGAPLPNTGDAFAPVANNALGGGLLPAQAPTDQPTTTTSLGGGAPQEAPKKVIDTVYVLPAPAVHSRKPANDATQPADQPRDHDNGGDQAGDDQGDDSTADDQNEGSDDQAGEDDHSNDGDHSDDGGGNAGGHEPGDD